jgi:hypothetical protein
MVRFSTEIAQLRCPTSIEHFLGGDARTYYT